MARADEVGVRIKLLTLRFGPLSESNEARLRTASVAELDRIVEGMLSATTLADLLDF